MDLRRTDDEYQLTLTQEELWDVMRALSRARDSVVSDPERFFEGSPEREKLVPTWEKMFGYVYTHPDYQRYAGPTA